MQIDIFTDETRAEFTKLGYLLIVVATALGVIFLAAAMGVILL